MEPGPALSIIGAIVSLLAAGAILLWLEVTTGGHVEHLVDLALTDTEPEADDEPQVPLTHSWRRISDPDAVELVRVCIDPGCTAVTIGDQVLTPTAN